MITKAIVRSINGSGNRCIVRLPLFETADSSAPVEANALVSITPGMFNNLVVGDVVFVGFEENALEKPIILGKLYRGTTFENETPGGMGIVNKLLVRKEASMPAADTYFRYAEDGYKHFTTPKNIADYIKWLEALTKKLINTLDGHFRCFKNWTQWQLKPENVEIDDGDLNSSKYTEKYINIKAKQYQNEGAECKICNNCTRSNNRSYLSLDTDKKTYPNL